MGVRCECWDHEPPGSVRHAAVPYWFKPYVIQDAQRRLNADLVAWMDASCVPTGGPGALDPFFDAVRARGVWAQHSGHHCARWTNDRCLRYMGVTRAEAETIPMVMAICVGFDLTNPAAQNLLTDWRRWAEQTTAFCGSWDDHRHHQSVLSILMHRAGFAPAPPRENGANYVVYGRGAGAGPGVVECYPA